MSNMLNRQALATIARFVGDAWGWCLDAALLIVRIVTYPFRWIALLFVRVVRLFAAVLPPVLLSGLLFEAIVLMESHRSSAWTAVEQYLATVIGGGGQVQLVGLLGSAGVLGWVLKKLGKAAWEELNEIWELFRGTLEDRWWPSFEISDSIDEMLEHFADVRETSVESWKSFGKLSLVIFATVPVVLMLIPNEESQIPASERMHVVVTDVSEAFASKVYMQEGSVFSLLHSANAKMQPPDSGQGVCLEGATLDWLARFKAGVKRCMLESAQDCNNSNDQDEPCLVLEVTGYASIAPEHADHLAGLCPVAPTGKSFNCKVANLRALAVGEFLAAQDNDESKKWMCPNDKELYWRASVCPAEDCPVGASSDGYVRRSLQADERSIGIRIRQWATEDDMKAGKPAADGELPDQRRYRVEVLNRAVHIKVLRDFCQSAIAPP